MICSPDGVVEGVDENLLGVVGDVDLVDQTTKANVLRS